jgi:hypothetical protein
VEENLEEKEVMKVPRELSLEVEWETREGSRRGIMSSGQQALLLVQEWVNIL